MPRQKFATQVSAGKVVTLLTVLKARPQDATGRQQSLVTPTISDQLRPILQAALANNRTWLPNHVYAGVVQEILGNGSIAVLIDNKVYQAITHIPVHSGDVLNLRLLGTTIDRAETHLSSGLNLRLLGGTTPEPRFAITGLANVVQTPPPAVTLQHSALPVVAMFSNLNPGIEGLATMLLQYPAQLARISPQLQPLLTAISSNVLPADDLSRPTILKQHVLASGFFYDTNAASGTDAADGDLKGLLLQLLGVLQHKRTLTLITGRPGFVAFRPGGSPANTANTLAQYTSQDDNTLTRDLKQIITQNAESTLLQIVSSQLAARDKCTLTDRALCMNLMIEHEDTFVPLELELRQHVTLEEEFWEAAFSIELPQSGKMQWTLTVKTPAVSVQLASNKEDTRRHMSSQAPFLNQLMELQGLAITHFSCIEAESL